MNPDAYRKCRTKQDDKDDEAQDVADDIKRITRRLQEEVASVDVAITQLQSIRRGLMRRVDDLTKHC